MRLFTPLFQHFRFFLCVVTTSLLAHAVTPIKNEDEIQKAIARARAYLDRTPMEEVGSLLLKMKLSPELLATTKVPIDDAFRRLFGSKYAVDDIDLKRLHNLKSKKDIHNLLQAHKFELKNYFYTFSKKYQKALLDGWDDILVKSLYCDISGYDDVDWNILQRLRDGEGDYFDTHQLMALLLVEENKCYDQKEIDQAKKDVIKDIVAAQHKSAQKKNDNFSDLFAERVVCLYWAKAHHLVDPRWIEIILKAQRDDGGWADSIAYPSSSTHPSSLAALGLKYFIAKNENEYFLYRR